jgi:hypothetical protein
MFTIVMDNEAPEGENHMAKHDETMNEKIKCAKSKADFIHLAGIGPELAGFVTEFVGKPENYYALPLEKRRAIENQMDNFLSRLFQ